MHSAHRENQKKRILIVEDDWINRELLNAYLEGEYEIAADTVIYAAGQRPLREEALALRPCAPEFYMLGDCVTPKNILAATQAAFQLARDIGR